MKILYVATVSSTIHTFLIPHIEMLVRAGHSVDIACNITTPASDTMVKLGCHTYNISFSRSPLSSSNFTAARQLRALLSEQHYDIVHTHTPSASACVRLVCRKLRKQGLKVIYTAHGFHFFKGAPLKNWLLYYPAERFLSRYTDILVTINKEDYTRAESSFKAKKTVYIPGVGIDLDRMTKAVIDVKEKRTSLDIPEQAFVLLSVGELNANKNHETVIRALAGMNNKDITYLICGTGDREAYLAELISRSGLDSKIRLLGYRDDMTEIFQAVDLFVHPSYREGLPVSLMEAMAAGLPCVVSNIRGNTDLIEDGQGGYICRPDDIGSFASAIDHIRSDRQRSLHMGQHNREAVKRFDIDTVLSEIRKIYEI